MIGDPASYWRVGRATEPMPEDKYYSDFSVAIDKAGRMADAEGVRVPIAVWDEQSDIVHLFLCGEQFRKV